ncbi:MAG: hypothetical protein V1798_00090 [Pseudomonadota bacterium]
MTQPRLLICATDLEFRILAEALHPSDSPVLEGFSDSPYKLWREPDSSVVCVVTGIGPKAARDGLKMALARTADTFHCAVGFGFCGGLVKTAGPGTLAIPTRILRDRDEETPTEWLRMSLAAQAGGSLLRTLVTSVELVPSVTEKAALFAAKGAEAVDMESACWGEVCRERGVPWAVVRSVLDSADEALPESFRNLTDRFGNAVWSKVLGRFLAHPQEARSALKMQRLARRTAGNALASILVRWLASERETERKR